MLTSNLLYLLLLDAVLDKENRLSTNTGLLAALGIILYGTCRTAINTCCNNQQANYNNATFANQNCNPNCNQNTFWAVNNLF